MSQYNEPPKPCKKPIPHKYHIDLIIMKTALVLALYFTQPTWNIARTTKTANPSWLQVNPSNDHFEIRGCMFEKHALYCTADPFRFAEAAHNSQSQLMKRCPRADWRAVSWPLHPGSLPCPHGQRENHILPDTSWPCPPALR